MADIMELLRQIQAGDQAAAEKLLPLVYHELRQLAAGMMAREKPGQTLQPTALVHEAYLRLVGPENQGADQPWNGRKHFFGAAAEAMRRILVERARHKNRTKHGADHQRVDLPELEMVADDRVEDILQVNQALDALGEADPQAANLVKLRFFVGLSLRDAAAALGIAPRTADRIWAYAKAWLQTELSD